MVRFPCPYCHRLLQAQPPRAGRQRRCPRCQGPFVEPTDPLPGVAPEKVDLDTADDETVRDFVEPATEEESGLSTIAERFGGGADKAHGGASQGLASTTSPADSQPQDRGQVSVFEAEVQATIEELGDGNSDDEEVINAVEVPVLAAKVGPGEGSKSFVRNSKLLKPKVSLDKFETREVLEPLEELGVSGLLIAWSKDARGCLKIGTTSGCSKEESEKVLLKAALQLIKAKSPRLYAKLLVELSKLDS